MDRGGAAPHGEDPGVRPRRGQDRHPPVRDREGPHDHQQLGGGRGRRPHPAKGAMEAMKQLGATLDAQGIDRNTMKADDGVARDMLGSTLSGMMSGIVEEKPAVSPGTQAYLDRMSQNYWLCGGGGENAEGDEPALG